MLSAVRVGARHGRHTVFEELSLDVPPGRVVGVLGPSGCGKSTLVRVLALLHAPCSGHVSIDGHPVRGTRYDVPAPVRRRIGLVTQHPRQSVDPRLTLADIVAEPLRSAGRRRSKRGGPAEPARVAELAHLVDLDQRLLVRRPHEVSDGQLQRASLARALAGDPLYLLLDEATAMLDASSTASFVRLLDRVRETHPVGVLTVGHDRELFRVWCDAVHDFGDLDAAAGRRHT